MLMVLGMYTGDNRNTDRVYEYPIYFDRLHGEIVECVTPEMVVFCSKTWMWTQDKIEWDKNILEIEERAEKRFQLLSDGIRNYKRGTK